MAGIELFALILFFVSFFAGLLGSLIGLGGGILVVPVLGLVFGLDIHLAIGASIVSIIATSSGAAAAYVRDHLTNVRAAILLELATSTGAVLGALLAPFLPSRALYFLFAGFLLLSFCHSAPWHADSAKKYLPRSDRTGSRGGSTSAEPTQIARSAAW